MVGANALGMEDKGPTTIILGPTRHPSSMTDRNGEGLESLGRHDSICSEGLF